MTDKQMLIKLAEKIGSGLMFDGPAEYQIKINPKATNRVTIGEDRNVVEWLFDKDGNLLDMEVIS